MKPMVLKKTQPICLCDHLHLNLTLAGCQRRCQEVLASLKAQCQLLGRDIAKLPRWSPPSIAGFLVIETLPETQVCI